MISTASGVRASCHFRVRRGKARGGYRSCAPLFCPPVRAHARGKAERGTEGIQAAAACPRPCARESSAPSCEVMRSCCSRRDDEGAVLRFCVRSCGLHRRWMAHPFMRDIQVCSYAAIAAMRSGAAKKDIFFVWDLKNFSFGGIMDYRKMSLFGMGTVQGNHRTEGGIPTWM